MILLVFKMADSIEPAIPLKSSTPTIEMEFLSPSAGNYCILCSKDVNTMSKNSGDMKYRLWAGGNLTAAGQLVEKYLRAIYLGSFSFPPLFFSFSIFSFSRSPKKIDLQQVHSLIHRGTALIGRF